jgi:dienelactone hydrolase
MTHSAVRFLPCLAIALLSVGLQAAAATARPSGSVPALPRRANFAAEQYPGHTVEYGALRTSDGAVLRTLVTQPTGSAGRRPAIHFLQWLSCDSVELAPGAADGWSQFIRGVITQSQALVLRVDKSGVGDSQGPPCHALDYDTELAHHRAAHAWLRARPDVDSERIIVLGTSMGSNFAPLVAQGQRVRGVAVWGGGARPWIERQLSFDRRAYELNGTPTAELATRLPQHLRFHLHYLIERQTPEQIAARDPTLGAIWSSMIGTAAGSHFGRPFAFHQQAQAQNWAAAWSQIDAPVLALLGEYDWFEEPRSAQWIAEIANARRAGHGQFVLLPGLDHNFARFNDPQSAFADRGGRADSAPVLAVLLPWLQAHLR